MNNWTHQAPVAVGGVGGSGTRVVAAIMKEAGYFIGSDLNNSLDNLWFTVLLKRPRLFGLRSDRAAVMRTGVALFGKLMTSGCGLDWNERRFLAAAFWDIFRHGHDHLGSGRGFWALRRIPGMVNRKKRGETARAEFAGWGWKEPNTHLFLEPVAACFPGVKYIHVIRHGLEVAYSRNQAQLFMWGGIFGVVKPVTPAEVPAASLEYWIRSNKQAIELGRRLLGDRFLLVNINELRRDPESGVSRILDFMGTGTGDPALRARLCALVRKPESEKRYQQFGLGVFPEKNLDEVRNFGFLIEH